MNLEAPLALSALRRGESGLIIDVVEDGQSLGDADASTLAQRLAELGFVPGARVEVLASLWIDADPLAVRVGGSTFALRAREAQQVLIRRLDPATART